MTQPASTPAAPGVLDRVRIRLDRLIPAIWREHLYKLVTAAVTALTALGVTTADKAGLWTQLGVATVTLLFAVLYAGTGIRATFYAVLTAASAVLLAYGIAQNINWAVITAAAAQALGLSTAAAKAVYPVSVDDGSADPLVA